jgi:hypothetical protein
LWILACVLSASAGSATAQTQTVTCAGKLETGDYTAVDVPTGKECWLYPSGTAVTVSGDVTVGDNAQLRVPPEDTLTVSGNVTVGKGARLNVEGANRFTVHGSLFAVNPYSINIATPPPGKAHIHGSMFVTGSTGLTNLNNVFIGGNLSIVNSAGAQLNANTVAGNVLFRNNKTVDPSNRFTANTIVRSLVCAGNTHPPTYFRPDDPKTGVPNKVGRRNKDQCSGL